MYIPVSDAASSPDFPKIPASYSDPSSYPTNAQLSPLSPPTRVPPILSPDGSTSDVFPMRVQPESTTSNSNPSSEDEQPITVKKEENINWIRSDNEPSLVPKGFNDGRTLVLPCKMSPVTIGLSKIQIPHAPKRSSSPAKTENKIQDITSSSAPVTTLLLHPSPPTPPPPPPPPAAVAAVPPTPPTPPAPPAPTGSTGSTAPTAPAAPTGSTSLTVLPALTATATQSSPLQTLPSLTCEEESDLSSSPSMESEREQTPMQTDKDRARLLGKRQSSGSPSRGSKDSGMEESNGRDEFHPKKEELDFSIDMSEY